MDHVASLVALVVAQTALALWLAATRSRARSDLRRAAAESTAQRRENLQLQDDRQFLIQFLKDFPKLSRSLASGVPMREIPAAILNLTFRSLQPRQVVVLVRRQGTGDDPQRARRLVVAAAGGEPPVKVGAEVEIGRGTAGYVAEARQVLNRADLQALPAFDRGRARQGDPSGLDADLLAPLLVDDETLGVIAVSGTLRTGDDGKAALRLIAQTAAEAIRTATAYTRMQTSADVDGLTGIFNKRHMHQVLAEAIVAARQNTAHMSVFLFDVDNFKNYNDQNGHPAGDTLLRELARLVRDNLRKNDVFGRFGGEEFLVVLPATAVEQALIVADKVRTAIAEHAFAHAEHQPLGIVSVSGGVAEYPDDALDSTGLLKAADEALYAAKHAGRNRVLAAERRYLSDDGPGVGTPAPGPA